MKVVTKELRKILNDEVLVKVLYTGICGTDIKLAKGEYPIAKDLFPLTLGHEFVGEIIEKGELIQGYSLGDLVVGKPTVQSCGSCPYCRSGKINLCNKRLRLGINADGAFATNIILKQQQLINVNSLNNPASGAWLEPISVVARGISQLAINPNLKICILGPGPIGILSALLIKEFGVHITMAGLESDQERLRFLRSEQIVHDILIDIDNTNLFDCVIDCTGSSRAINNGLKWIKPSSQMLLLGTNKAKMNIDFSLIVYKELQVTGTIGANELDWDYALQFLNRNELILSKLTRTLPFSSILDGFKSNDSLQAKTIIQF